MIFRPLLHSTNLKVRNVDFSEPMAIKLLTLLNPQLEMSIICLKRHINVSSLPSILKPLTNLTRLDLQNVEAVSVQEILKPVSRLTKLRQDISSCPTSFA
jgi:hypothetical protein